MSTKTIPDEAREAALHSIARFNKEVLGDGGYAYVPRFRGKFLYLYRNEFGDVMAICRLEYRRKGRWDFAIYKYSSDRYDPEEFMFPGSEFVDGTVAGAMKAGMAAYP